MFNLLDLFTGVFIGVGSVLLIQSFITNQKLDEFADETRDNLNTLAIQRDAMAKIFDEMTEERKKAFDKKLKK